MSARTRARHAGAVVPAVLTAVAMMASGCAPATGSGLAGERRALPVSRREEQVRIGSFATVQAVAATRRYVFAGAGGGIAVYDRLRQGWLPPLTRDVGIADQQVTIMVGDPVEDALWLGVPGGVLMYRPDTEQWQRTMVTGVPDAIVFDRRSIGDALVRAGGQWMRVSRVGVVTPLMAAPTAASVLVPSSLTQLYQQYPMLRTSPQSLLRNQASNRPLQHYVVLSGAASPDRVSDVWLGTDGDGLYRFDPSFLQAQSLRFGLMEPGVGAMALAADGVWMAGTGQSTRRAGLTFASSDLQHWRWIDGTIAVPLVGARAYAMATRANRAWVGTSQGLVRVWLDGAQDMTLWSSLDGLPDERVLAVAPRDAAAWIGTPRGIVRIADSTAAKPPATRGLGARMLDNVPVYALLFTGDTLWIGSEQGLLALPRAEAGGGTLARPSGEDPALRRAVRSLASSDSVLLAATDDAVLSIIVANAARGQRVVQRVEALLPSRVGQVTRVGLDAQAMWVSGTQGVVMVSRSSGAMRVLRGDGELGGPVLDVVASPDWLWVGTPQGVVRLRRSSDGLVY